MVKAKSLKKSTRLTASTSKTKMDCSCCVSCQKLVGDDVRALQCDKCGDSDGVLKCSECFSMSDELYDELMDLPTAGSLRWYCVKCEKSMFKSADRSDMKLDAVLKLLAQATEKITKLEDVIRALQESSKVFEENVSKKMESTDNKVQLLLDINVPLNDTAMDDDGEVVVNTQLSNDNDGDNLSSTSTVVNSKCNTGSAFPVAQKSWSGLFKCLSSVTTDVRALKEAATAKSDQSPASSDETIRSVVVYGLPELRDRNDTLLIDDVVKSLDGSISVASHRRLRAKSDNSPLLSDDGGSSKPPPTLIVLTTAFDQRKLLSLSSNLRSSEKFKSVFIKKALTRSELGDLKELRQKCRIANDAMHVKDPQMEVKYSVIDGKIRRLFRSADTYKVDWSKVFSANDLQKN